MRLKPVAQPGAERSIVDRAANLEQEIGTSSGAAHLLRLVHSPIDEKVCGSLGDRSSDAQLGTVPHGVVDEPTTLTSERAVDAGSARQSLREGAFLACWPSSSL